jgi:hypothetical protein
MACVLSGRKLRFRRFTAKHRDFGAVDEWLMSNPVTLTVEGLNIIHCDTAEHGDISSLTRASERFRDHAFNDALFFVWRPFVAAYLSVLRKSYHLLRGSLENPTIEVAKTFEALTQLVVLVQLLSKQSHTLSLRILKLATAISKGRRCCH